MNETPSIKRRLIAMVYETFLLLAVEMLAVAVYMLVTKNGHGPAYQAGLSVFLFLVTGVYFVWCWTNSGHTLAMKTWRMAVLTPDQGRVPRRQAVLRYLLAWGWFVPALAVCALFGLRSKTEIGIAVAAGIALWSLSALFDRDRQFLHDRLAGTRVVALPKAAKPAGAAAKAA